MARRVAITGLGIVSPIGIGTEIFWENLIKGKSGISRITQFDTEGFDAKIAGEINDFDPLSVITQRETRRTARFVQFSLAAAQEAIETSGIDLSVFDPFRCGVIIGSGVGCLRSIENAFGKYLQKGPKKITPFLIPMMITNEAAGTVAIRYGCKGINFCTVSACASGAHAVGAAYRAITEGSSDVMICGGAESCITHLGVGGFCSLKALSTRNDDPEKASRPFDRERDGFVMSEGAGILVLEELSSAQKRGAKIYAELSGYGATCDAYHVTAPDPEGTAAAQAMEQAMKQSGISGSEALYINAHGTSTKLNDAMETQAIKKVFGSNAAKVPVSSTKSMTGHMLGAAGAVETIVCAKALKEQVIPPTINYENPDPDCDLDYVPNQARKEELKAALTNSLGFGGHNTSLALKAYK